MKDFEKEWAGKFNFLDRKRVDVNEEVTVLGCTLWSHIDEQHTSAIGNSLTDFDEVHGIWERSVEEHNADHARNLAWVNNRFKVLRIKNRTAKSSSLHITCPLSTCAQMIPVMRGLL